MPKKSSKISFNRKATIVMFDENDMKNDKVFKNTHAKTIGSEK